jgi:hypothetical protein
MGAKGGSAADLEILKLPSALGKTSCCGWGDEECFVKRRANERRKKAHTADGGESAGTRDGVGGGDGEAGAAREVEKGSARAQCYVPGQFSEGENTASPYRAWPADRPLLECPAPQQHRFHQRQ